MRAAQRCLDSAAKRLGLAAGDAQAAADAGATECVGHTDRLALATLHCQPQSNYLRLREAFRSAARERVLSQIDLVRAAAGKAEAGR